MSLNFDYDTLAEVGEYDYSWTQGYLIRRSDSGQLLFGVTSGCSCNSWSENIEEGELTAVGSWQEAVELAKKHNYGYSDHRTFNDGEIADFVKSLMDKPADMAGAKDMWS